MQPSPPITSNCAGPGDLVLGRFAQLKATGGDVVLFPAAEGRLAILVNDADALRHVLVRHPERYERETHWQHALPLLAGTGQEFLAFDGRTPASVRLARWDATGRAFAEEVVRELGCSQGAANITRLCHRASLATMARTLFGVEMGDDADRFLAVVRTLDLSRMEDRAEFYLPDFHSDATRKAAQQAATLELLEIAERIRSAAGEQAPGDLTLIRRGIAELLLLAYDSFANSAGFGLLVLAEHSELAEYFRERPPDMSPDENHETVPHDFRGMFVRELLRYYPPVWMTARRTLVEDRIGDVTAPPGTIFVICPYTLHRNPRYWLNPAVFDPGRFAVVPEHPLAFCPFGAGPRMCVASGFSLRQLAAVFSAVLTSYELRPCSETPLRPEVMTNLRPPAEARIHAVRRDR